MECYRSLYPSKTSSGTHIVPAQQVNSGNSGNSGNEETITGQQPASNSIIYIVVPQVHTNGYVETITSEDAGQRSDADIIPPLQETNDNPETVTQENDQSGLLYSLQDTVGAATAILTERD